MLTRLRSIAILLFITCSSSAQTSSHFALDTTTSFVINNQTLLMPMTGGLNSPVFCQIDFNGDGKNDLLILDRVGNRISTFIFNPNLSNLKYEYAPSYISKIPPIHDWVSSYDYDCDGDLDLMTYFNNSIGIWRNDFTVSQGISFSLVTTQINSTYVSGVAPIFSTQVNLSAFEDVDNDGDMDILTFTNSGNFIEYHKNYSIDSLGVCNQLLFKVEPDCWGHFRLSGLTNSALLNQNCVTNRIAERESHLHSGSVLTVLDEDCDGDVDLINGDILGSNLLYMKNGGNSDSASIVLQDSIFPSYNQSVNLQNLPAAFYFDADGDSIKDLIVTPFATVGEDINNVLFYKNTGSNCQNNFSFIKNNFLVDEMVDAGTASNVSFFDVNNDGKKDLIISCDYIYNSNPNQQYSRLIVYFNTSVGGNTSFELGNSNWLNLPSAISQFGVFPAFGDLDGDGDDDLLLGNSDGTLIYYQNTGAGNFILNNANFQSIDVGNNSAPQIVDVDRDGKNDLVVGERSGVLNYYRNVSSGSSISFVLQTSNFGGVNVRELNSVTGYSCPLLFDNGNGYELFVGSESGSIFHYQNIDNNLNGQFLLVDSAYDNIKELRRVTLAMNDYNSDGKIDIITGNSAGGIRGYLNNFSNGILNDAIENISFEVYPNPVIYDNYIYLRFDNVLNNTLIKIYDVLGNELQSQKINNQYMALKIDDFKTGTYMIKVIQGDRTFSKKIIRL